MVPALATYSVRRALCCWYRFLLGSSDRGQHGMASENAIFVCVHHYHACSEALDFDCEFVFVCGRFQMRAPVLSRFEVFSGLNFAYVLIGVLYQREGWATCSSTGLFAVSSVREQGNETLSVICSWNTRRPNPMSKKTPISCVCFSIHLLYAQWIYFALSIRVSFLSTSILVSHTASGRQEAKWPKAWARVSGWRAAGFSTVLIYMVVLAVSPCTHMCNDLSSGISGTMLSASLWKGLRHDSGS